MSIETFIYMKTITKALATIILAAASSGVAGAQSYMFDNPENRTYFGVRAGLDISSAANGGAMFSNKAGFSAGAYITYPSLPTSTSSLDCISSTIPSEQSISKITLI